MPKLTLDIPDAVYASAESSLRARGDGALKAYLRDVLETPANANDTLDEEMIAAVREARKTPLIRVDDAFWERHIDRVTAIQRNKRRRKSA